VLIIEEGRKQELTVPCFSWHTILAMTLLKQSRRTGTGFTDEDLSKLPKMKHRHIVPYKHVRVNSILEAYVWFEPAVTIENLGAEITLIQSILVQ